MDISGSMMTGSQMPAADLTSGFIEQMRQSGQRLDSLNLDSQADLDEIKNARMNAIEQAASDFESIFISIMLKEMRNTLDQQDGGLFDGDKSDTMGGMFDMFMSKHLAQTQPIGVGAAVKTYLQNQLGQGETNHEAQPPQT